MPRSFRMSADAQTPLSLTRTPARSCCKRFDDACASDSRMACYTITDGEIRVLAVMNLRRRPGYWSADSSPLLLTDGRDSSGSSGLGVHAERSAGVQPHPSRLRRAGMGPSSCLPDNSTVSPPYP